jgi:6,7-dimethyl-8-ribityllumazine synthase
MVNKIPSYVISAGGKFAILSSRCHPASSQVMAAASKDALESCGVESDDIYLIDCPSDSLLTGMSREIAKSGSFAAVISLAVLANGSEHAESIRIGMTTSDFSVPVIPALVPESCGESAIALAAQKAARSAIELVNFSSMLSEFSVAQNFADLEDEGEEAPPAAKPRATRARRTTAAATTNGRRTKRKTR